MKQKIIGDKGNNQIIKQKAEMIIEDSHNYYKGSSKPKSSFGFLKNIGNSIKGLFSFRQNAIKRQIYERECCDAACDACDESDSDDDNKIVFKFYDKEDENENKKEFK